MNMNLSDNIDKARKICEKVTEENEKVKVESQKLTEENEILKKKTEECWKMSHKITELELLNVPHFSFRI